MKNKLFVLLLFLCAEASAQNILRVNNTTGVNAPYTTIQAAIAAASAGDIILVEGSNTTYSLGSLTLSKKLTIQGPGFFLTENTGIQAIVYPATISATSFILASGSDGSVISGLTFSTPIDVRTSNITISNNLLSYTNYSILLSNTAAASNFLFSGNYITGSGGITSTGQSFTNVVISNNFFLTTLGYSLNLASNLNGIINNNIIFSGGGGVAGFVTMPNFTISNNIFTNTGTSFGNVTNSTVQNNVFVASSQAGADGTNIFSASVASLFVGLSGNTSDTQYKLKSGSPAIGAGVSGVDCGVFGGLTPYNISGVKTGQSTITGFTVPASVSQNGTLSVKVSAKVN